MRTLLRRYLSVLLSIFIVSQLNLGIQVTDDISLFLSAGLILAIILLIKVISDALLFPIHLITLNLSNWFLYFVLIYLWVIITPGVKFAEVNFPGIKSAALTVNPVKLPLWLSVFASSLILVLILKVMNWILK